MKEISQIILDTNILVAAFRSRRGAANLLLDKLNDSSWQVNVSTALLLEYEDVLKRPEMKTFVSDSEVDIFLDGLCTIA
jgi:predicted nucleic acid-binding protein